MASPEMTVSAKKQQTMNENHHPVRLIAVLPTQERGATQERSRYPQRPQEK